MKKLAFVINVFREDNFHSGGERVFYELVNRAVKNGWHVDLYCTTYLGEKDILKSQINNIFFLGHPKDFKYPEKIEKFYEKVKELTDKQNYDSIISENISPVLDVGILQGHSLLHYKKISGNFLEKLWFHLLKSKYINAQKKWLKTPYRKIIVPSKTLKEELIENFGIEEKKFAVIYPCVDKPVEICNFEKNTAFEFVFGLSAPSFKKKGGNIFLKALSILKKQGYSFKAKIIYPKEKKNMETQFLLAKYGLKNNVEFLPHQQNMRKFYDSIDVLVMPSLVETFGLVALEAMIAAKPAIVSSYCGASEIFEGSENNFVFDIKNNSALNLAEKMKFFIDNRENYSQFSQFSYNLAQKYNWQDFCDRFFENI